MIKKLYNKLKKTAKEDYEYGENEKEDKEIRNNIGMVLIDELNKKKSRINDESNCIKCRRTQRNTCKKHERMLLGLDALQGQIAQKYLDKKPRYLRNED